MSARGIPRWDDVAPIPLREEIDKCLNCTKPECDNCSPRKERTGKLVRCIETGETYRTQDAAAKAVGVSPSAMSFCLRGITQSCGGRHFEYIKERRL